MVLQTNNTKVGSQEQPINAMKTSTTIRQNLFSLTPKTLSEAMEYAKIIANSSMVPKNFQGRPGDVLVAVQMGVELGLPPTQALQNIAVINGRPSLWGDAVLAIVRGSPLCDYVRESFDPQTNTATCVVKRTDDVEEVIQMFSDKDAKRAGLWGKVGPWTQYPQRMMQMRARSWALRDAFPDLLRGISVYEEQQDCVETMVTPVAAKKSVTGSKAESLLNKLEAQPAAESITDIDTDDSNDNSSDALSRIVDQIDESQSEEELTVVAEQAKLLSEEDQIIARELYKQKLKALRGTGHTKTVEMLQDVFVDVDNTEPSEHASMG